MLRAFIFCDRKKPAFFITAHRKWPWYVKSQFRFDIDNFSLFLLALISAYETLEQLAHSTEQFFIAFYHSKPMKNT